MSRSISDDVQPEEQKPQIENAELFDISMGIFFSLEQIHRKMDAILEHLGLGLDYLGDSEDETPEN